MSTKDRYFLFMIIMWGALFANATLFVPMMIYSSFLLIFGIAFIAGENNDK